MRKKAKQRLNLTEDELYRLPDGKPVKYDRVSTWYTARNEITIFYIPVEEEADNLKELPRELSIDKKSYPINFQQTQSQKPSPSFL